MSAPRETTDIQTAAERLGISRGYAYELARTGWLVKGRVQVLKVGERYVVPTVALDETLGGVTK